MLGQVTRFGPALSSAELTFVSLALTLTLIAGRFSSRFGVGARYLAEGRGIMLLQTARRPFSFWITHIKKSGMQGNGLAADGARYPPAPFRASGSYVSVIVW
jgi:hypothetical protein